MICETAERLTEEGEPALRLYLLVVGALRALAEREHDAGLIPRRVPDPAMTTSGWEPALLECAKCGEPGPHVAFNVPAGGAVCDDCRPPGSARPQLATILLMAALLSGDWGSAEASGAAERTRVQWPDHRPPDNGTSSARCGRCRSSTGPRCG